MPVHAWLRSRLALLLPLLLLAVCPRDAAAITQIPCNQTDNTRLLCLGDPCTISQNFAAPTGCNLDFGSREVIFKGTFDVGSTALTVSARSVRVDGVLRASPGNNLRGGTITLTATGGGGVSAAGVCGQSLGVPDGCIVVTGRIEVSGNSAGVIRFTAGGAIDLKLTADVLAIGFQEGTVNSASGGVIIANAKGGALNDAAQISVKGGNQADGGGVAFQAATNIVVARAIDATGGANDGGDVDLLAGDDISIQHTIDVSSVTEGSGGSIRARAGVDTVGGTKEGGTLTLSGDLVADGNSDIDSGYDGGDIDLASFGKLTIAATASVHANGGSPDGAGGSLDLDSSDRQFNRITGLDGDLDLNGAITLRGVGLESDGGAVDVTAGRTLTIAGAIDIRGASGGGMTADAGKDLALNAEMLTGATTNLGGGGSVILRAGNADFGKLTITRSIDASAGASGFGEDQQFMGCNLMVQSSVVLDGSGGTVRTGRIDLAAPGSMTLGNGSHFVATPGGKIVLTHRPGGAPVIGSGVVFSPSPPIDAPLASSPLYPACPVCGDGIRQAGEVCDTGEPPPIGACCNATCSAFTCPTATATPTVTPTSTAATRTATPTPTATRTPTPTPTPTLTPTPTATPTVTLTPTPTATPTSSGVTATPTVTLTPTPTATPTSSGVTATPTTTSTADPATPTPTVTSTTGVTTTPTATATPASATATRTATPTPRPPSATPSVTPTVILPLIQPKPVLGCAHAFGQATSALALANVTALEGCALDVFKCVQSRLPAAKRDTCLTKARARCGSKLDKLDRARARFSEDLSRACGDPARVPLLLVQSAAVLGFETLDATCMQDFGLSLNSLSAIEACVRFTGSCRSEQALAVGVPRISDLLADGMIDIQGLEICVPPPSGNDAGLDSAEGTRALKCQKSASAAARKLLKQQIDTARQCVDGLLKCRLTGHDRATCEKVAARCGARLALLTSGPKSARAKLAATVQRACGTLTPDALRGARGIGFDQVAARCTDLGVTPATEAGAIGTCIARAYGCAGNAIVRHALPLVDGELAPFGLHLDSDPFCVPPTPTPTVTATATRTVTPTPTVTASPTMTAAPGPTPTSTASVAPTSTASTTHTATPTGTATPTPAASETPTASPTANGGETPTASATPSPTETATPTISEPTATPTVGPPGCGNGVLEPGEQCDLGDTLDGDGCDHACKFELLVPGGGTRESNCLSEWAVINPNNEPAFDGDGLPNLHQTCVDGDPSCDADGVVNDECRFRVAICFLVPDPNLPECAVTPALAKYTLQIPRPGPTPARDPIRAANAAAIIRAFEWLSDTTPIGRSDNIFLFDPPLAVVPPDNCTALAEVVVPLQGQTTHDEGLRGFAVGAPLPDQSVGVRDRDTLRLICVRP